MSIDLCADDTRSSFRIARAIFVLILVATGFGMAFFIYQLSITQLVDIYGGMPISIDETSPPYIGIICIGVFIASWVGLWHIKKLEHELCGRPY